MVKHIAKYAFIHYKKWVKKELKKSIARAFMQYTFV